MTWEIINTEYFTHDLLSELMENEIAAIRVPAFISTEVCKRIVEKMPVHFFRSYEYKGAKENKVSKIGIVQHEHEDNAQKKAQYFKEVENATRQRQQVFQDSGDLLYYVMGFVKAAWGKTVQIAEEDEHSPYFAGLIRSIGAGALHFDWAPLDAKGWMVSQISAQLTWNLYLQMGAEGGAIKIYRRYGQDDDKKYKVAGSIHTDYILVENVESVTISPTQGELVFFNPHNYHVIEKTEGEEHQRITFSSFLGYLDQTESLLFWS